METTEMIEQVKMVLQPKRFEHTLRVAKEAVILAKRYNVPEDKAEVAAILHDYAKNFPSAKLKKYIENSALPQDLLQYNEELWHGPVASILLAQEFGIIDEDIQAAIRYHTTGRANMSDLERIIYLADYMEPGRSFPGLAEVRETAEVDLVKACWLVSKNTIQFLMNQKVTIHPDSFYAYNDFTKQMMEEK